jgi:hypothetical protein
MYLHRVIRSVVGLRRYRRHLAGGLTFSSGTAHLAVEQALPTGVKRMAASHGPAAPRERHRSLDLHDSPADTTSNTAGAQVFSVTHLRGPGNTGISGAVRRGGALLLSPQPALWWATTMASAGDRTASPSRIAARPAAKASLPILCRSYGISLRSSILVPFPSHPAVRQDVHLPIVLPGR